ncbi:alpha/beta hydrolase [Dactylosporangium sp. CA-233914]|uniref:alpha/beta fold hydrolase n=1 Tax=Dactylosporangium sp. CA-233914 TaxID=3239934 RepID=UPI003D92C9D5
MPRLPGCRRAEPAAGLTSDPDYVRALLQSINGPIVLVGHSYGGAVIANAARGVPNVRALVYVGAFVPGRGESIATVPDPATYPSLLGPGTHRDAPRGPTRPGPAPTWTSRSSRAGVCR